jgi:hypothetical protein
MRIRPTASKTFIWALAALLITTATFKSTFGQNDRSRPTSIIPKTWDDQAIGSLEVPLADTIASPVHVSADYYYRIPVRPLYKTYPVYHPSEEPPGYFERLKTVEPELTPFDPSKFKTEADWIKAGELIFDEPIDFDIAGTTEQFRDPSYYTQIGIPVAKDGTVPFARYVVREKGKVEVGAGACGMCHTRVMPDGAVLKGAQGNFPFDRSGPREFPDEVVPLIRRLLRLLYDVPWLATREPALQFDRMTIAEIFEQADAIPLGVEARHGTGLHVPAQIPDLIGVRERKYLDHTGLVQHRDIADLMRYAALNQGVDLYARYGSFVPIAEDYRTVPEPYKDSPFPFANARYSDEQLYALAQFIYSLQPPQNPNKMDDLDRNGQNVFAREGCASCHTPPLYTNNKLTPTRGFQPRPGDLERFDIMPISVGTDPTLALKTRRGTGYYKVPSLKGVWYRGPFEHNGSVTRLEDWFDARRLRDDYTPSGWKGAGVKTRAVKGHEFGLNLSREDKRALIAFLKTL